MDERIKNTIDLHIRKWNHETIGRTLDSLFLITIGYLVVIVILSIISKIPVIIVIFSFIFLVLLFIIKQRNKKILEIINKKIEGEKSEI